MERDEVKQILIILEVAYPSFTIPVEKKRATVDLWNKLFEGYTYKEVEVAVHTYIKTSGSAYAPSASQILEMLGKPAELSTLTPAEAWVMVSKALRNSTYHSKEEFDKLPEDVQKALGGPSQLYAWAIDENYAEGVAMSNFQKVYNIVVNRRLEISKMPEEMQMMIEQKRADYLGLEQKEDW